MTHEKITAAKNIPGGILYQKNVLQIFNQLNKENENKNRISTREESKERQNRNDVINNNEIKNKNMNKSKAYYSRLVGNSSASVQEKRRSHVGYALSYCVAFSPDLKKCKCNIHENHITVRTAYNCSLYEYLQDKMTAYTVSLKVMANKFILNQTPLSRRRRDSKLDIDEGVYKELSQCTTHAAVTLITVGWAEDYNAGTMDPILESWCGPKVKCWNI